MQAESKIILPCGNMGVLYTGSKEYICNYCHSVVGSADEPPNCKAMREKAEPYKNDYWMNINDHETN
jgi:hypothetical protein